MPKTTGKAFKGAGFLRAVAQGMDFIFGTRLPDEAKPPSGRMIARGMDTVLGTDMPGKRMPKRK